MTTSIKSTLKRYRFFVSIDGRAVELVEIEANPLLLNRWEQGESSAVEVIHRKLLAAYPSSKRFKRSLPLGSLQARLVSVA